MRGNINTGWLKEIVAIIHKNGQTKNYHYSWMTEEVLKTDFGKRISGHTKKASCNAYLSQHNEIFKRLGGGYYTLRSQYFKEDLIPNNEEKFKESEGKNQDSTKEDTSKEQSENLKINSTPVIKNEDDEEKFPEGKEKYKFHIQRERSQTLIRVVKEKRLQKDPKLKCEICGFSFVETYGDLGKGFIEAHHIFPISELKVESKTKPEDIVLICSNCHRMIHRKRPLCLTIKEAKKLLIRK